MWWPFQWLVIYILGGLTFVPLLVIAVIGYVLTYGSVPIGDPDPDKKEKAALQEQEDKETIINQAARSRSSSLGNNGKPLSGWLTIRRQFQPSTTSTSVFLPTNTTAPSTPSQETSGAAESEDANNSAVERDDASTKSGTSTPSQSQPTTYSARIANTYRQVMESRQKKDAPPKEFFFCVLKGSVLFLYEDEAQSECVAAIGVDKYTIGVEGKEGGAHKGKDAEMFAKRNAIVMRIEGDQKGLPVLAKGMGVSTEEAREEEKELESASWFIFSKSNIKMEDWYLALLQASASKPTTSDVFASSDMQALVDTIDTEPDPIPMRWLNAILGRIFFGVYRTEALEQFIIGKIMKKLSKVPRPSFLSPIVIREVNVGTFPPIFSKPMLKDLTGEGTASFEVHLNYRSRPAQPNSEIRITIATTATIPTGFKPYVVDLVLAVVLKSLEGNMVVQIKRPPSNRFWYGFTQMPKMELEIQPVVSERKIQIGMVLKAIEKQLREVIAESVVLPNMDDIAFFDTSALDLRGGIFSSAGKIVSEPTKDISAGAGGSETPTQPGVDVGTAAEDPSSATAETPTLRKRRPTKSHTIDAKAAGSSSVAEDTEDAVPEIGIVRTETAPPNIGTGPTAKKAAAIQATKKWFANTGRPTSISSLSAVSGKNPSQESLGNGRSRSADRRPESTSTAIGTIGTSAAASTSAPELAEEGTQAHLLAPAPIQGQTSFHSLGRSSIDSTSTTSTGHTVIDRSSPVPAPGSSSPSGASSASLITSLRARDKKAIQSQVTTARDAVKKWGVNWAAKRKTTMGSTLEEVDTDKPAAIYRPPDEDEIGSDAGSTASTAGFSRSVEAPKSLKERLEAAATAAQARPKSGSFSSTSPISIAGPSAARPILQTTESPTRTPSIKGGSSVGSPPNWTLSSSGPTTEIAKDTLVATASSPAAITRTESHHSHHSHHSHNSHTRHSGSNQEHTRRNSNSHPVYTQPVGGRSMVVPRIPKRPGEVVGIGSSDMGISRTISSEKDSNGKSSMVSGGVDHGAASVPPPPLPSRTTQLNGKERGRETEKTNKAADPTPLPERAEHKKAPGLPPRTSKQTQPDLPPKTDSAIDSSGSPSPADPAELKRSDSDPLPAAPPNLPARNTHLPELNPGNDVFKTKNAESAELAKDTTKVSANVKEPPAGADLSSSQDSEVGKLAASRADTGNGTLPATAVDVSSLERVFPKKGDSGASAEDVLRNLVKRDEEVRAQKGTEGGSQG